MIQVDALSAKLLTLVLIMVLLLLEAVIFVLGLDSVWLVTKVDVLSAQVGMVLTLLEIATHVRPTVKLAVQVDVLSVQVTMALTLLEIVFNALQTVRLAAQMDAPSAQAAMG